MKIKAKKQTVIARSVTPMRSIVAMFLVTLLLAACGDDNKNAGGTVEDGEVVAIVDKTISGVSQKGPFVNGSSVTVQELDGKILAQTGLGFEGKIKNDLGEFSVKVNKLESQYALLKANGYYRNEVTGEKSKSQITLYALTDLSKRDEVNVNLLTHLAYERSLYLAMVDTLSVAKAKKQAEVEILNSFGIEGDFAAAEDLNIFGADDQSAALLAMSILMQSDLSEGDFSERLADYAADIESDGIWNDAKTATEIADWANALWLRSGLAIIRENIVKWDLSADVPAFEKYVNNFWWQNYGLGICDAKREGEVLKNQNTASVNADVYYICKSNLWQVASDIEKDTYKWLDLTTKRTEKDGDVRYGDVVATNCYVFEDKAWRSGNANDCSLNLRGCTKLRKDTVGKGSDSVWHVCHNRTWRNATTYEKDTFGWKDSTDGAIKKGNVTDSIYVFDKTAWRVTSNVEAKLGGCVSAIADSVGRVGLTYYICKSNKWIEASAIEYDTYRWTAGKDGDSKVGSVNANNCYVYENKAWRSGNKTDCTLSLRGCTALRQDTVALGSDKVWHICDSKTWRNATTYEKDTFGWKDSTDGAIKKGNVTDSIYVFDKTAWRVTSNVEAKLGGCVSAIADSVGRVGLTYYICKSNKWIEASAIEYDTYRWTAGKDGDSKVGSVNANNCYVYENKAWRSGNKTDCTLSLRGCTALRQDTVALGSDKVWHICDSKTWRNATTYEKDTFGWKDSTDGAIRKGNETDSAYKYDEISGKWVMATQNDTTLKLMGCTAKRMGEVSMSSADDTYYVCKNRDWLVAQEVEYDTYGEKCTNVNVGKIIAGKVTATNMYYCMANGWVSLMVWDWDVPKEARLNQEITYGTITDNRDGKNYRTVTIGDQTWMAENLNYADSIKTSSLRGKSWCYNNELKNCEVAGRLYTWAAAIDSVKLATDPDNPLDCGSGKTCGLSGMVQGICPSGWHLPDTTEWNVLFLAVGGTPTAGKVLKSQTGWPNNGNGTDSFGFSALPTGYRNYTGSFEIDSGIAFWSSTENNTFNWTSHEMCIIDREDSFLLYTNNNVGLSIRCVKDSV